IQAARFGPWAHPDACVATRTSTTTNKTERRRKRMTGLQSTVDQERVHREQKAGRAYMVKLKLSVCGCAPTRVDDKSARQCIAAESKKCRGFQPSRRPRATFSPAIVGFSVE